MLHARKVAGLSLIFTAFFFLEYTSVLRRVHLPYDLNSYHYPLSDYAFQAIRHGRFPQWDPTIYCGLSFIGNVQAALFYPPQWLMFLGAMGHPKLSYQAMEYLVFAHVWLAFLLCYLWLLWQKRLNWLASALGAGIFAFSGLMLLQLQHLGLIGAYTWMPLGFWGIDEAAERKHWRPLWKLGVAFTMCILAGYPSMWVVFAISMAAYALMQRMTVLTACALGICFLFAAIAVLPAWEASRTKSADPKYTRASGIRDPAFYISYFVPNYFDFSMKTDVQKNLGREYLYLGSPAFVGLALLTQKKRAAPVAPFVGVLLASLLFLTNPFGLLGWAMEGTFLSDVFSAWYFLAGVTAAIAPMAAIGLDAGLRRTSKAWPDWLVLIVTGLTVLWAARLISVWVNDGFSVLWRSGIDALIGTILCAALVFAFAGSKGRISVIAAAGVLLLTAAEYKSFGTSKRFNASPGPFDTNYAAEGFPEMDSRVYEALRAHPEYRMAVDFTGPDPVRFRHSGLTTPQGMDPFLPRQYQALIEKIARFYDHRQLELDPDREASLRLLGVRYFGTSTQGPLYPRLMANPHFHLMKPDKKYYKIFELADAQPAFGWEQTGSAEITGWEPERRAFQVHSQAGGVFRLSEQNLPGWKATVDGRETSIEHCHDALQCISLPAGDHAVEFRYRSRWLIPGAMISLLSVLAAMLVWLKTIPAAPIAAASGS